MLPDTLEEKLQAMVRGLEHPREMAVDVMYALQDHFGYFCDEAVGEASRILDMTPLELEELATFYDFIYREPVGRYVIHVCDGVVCWMNGEEDVFTHLCDTLGIGVGQTSPDGLFTLLPAVCIGNCHRAPAMLVNGRFHGPLTREMIDSILDELRSNPNPGFRNG